MELKAIGKELIEVADRYLELYDLLLEKEKDRESLSDKEKKILSIIRVFKDNNIGSVGTVKRLSEKLVEEE